MILVAIGLQWGDEGKGKILDVLTERAECVVRFNGGSNAGGSVESEGVAYSLHQVPVGVIRDLPCVMGHGVVVNFELLQAELEGLRAKGCRPQIFLSDRAHVVQSKHRRQDDKSGKIGTTGMGIGNCYADKMMRQGLRVCDLVAEVPSGVTVTNTGVMLRQMRQEGKRIMLQGVQGSMLDIDNGTYPYVTSSATTSAGACVGSGIPPHHIDKVVGIVKAYTTRVGEGTLPTEEPEASFLQSKGAEVGVTTGRKRRCGWLDFVALRHAVAVSGVDALAVTKLDILCGVAEVPVCVGYRYRGQLLPSFPANIHILEEVEPVYETMAGWSQCDESDANYKAYLQRIEEELGVPIVITSTGADRRDTHFLQDLSKVWSVR